LSAVVVPVVDPLPFDPAQNVRVAAVMAFEWPLDVLARLVADPDPAVRRDAAWGLHRLGVAAIPTLATVRRNDPDDQVRAAAASALDRLCTDENEGVRQLAQEAIREIVR